MNIYEELNNKIQTFLEGEVIDFTKFKKEKDVDKLTDNMFNAPQENEVRLNGIQPQKCEIDGVPLFDSINYSAKDFQAKLIALKTLLDLGKFDDKGCTIEFFCTLTDKDLNSKIPKMRVELSEIDKDFDLIELIEDFMENNFAVVNIVNGERPSQKDIADAVDDYRKIFNKTHQDNASEAPLALAKDYSNEGKKYGEDVEEGDILYQMIAYGTTSYTFFKVIKRTLGSIRVTQLEKQTKLINDDDGRVVPAEKVKANPEVDGRTIRIHKSKGDWDNVVCKIGGYNCYYWNGQPKRETYMD